MITKEKIQEKMEKGAIIARLVIELLGKPKEHIEETLKLVVQRLKEEGNVDLLKEEIFEAQFREDTKLFSSFVELEILVKDLPALSSLCFFYLPSSVEIIEPAEMLLKCSDSTDLINNLMGKLHEMDMSLKNLRLENETHAINMGQLLRSSICAILEKKKSMEEIAQLLNIPKEQTNTILDHLQKEKLIKKHGDLYGVE